MEFEGRTVLVTGAAQGIGAATARMFARAGASVVVNDFAQDERGATLVREIEQAGGQAMYVDADVSDWNSVCRMVDAAESTYGAVDVLVNNAAILGHARVVDMEPAEWDRVLRVNLTGQFLCAKAVLSGMYARRFGKIVNVSSEGALFGVEGLAHYCAAKGGAISFTKALAREAAPYGVNVNCVAPGPVDTAMWAPRSDAFKADVLAGIPLARWGTADDVANTVLFLASERASFYAGWTLSPNGGATM